MDHSVYLHIVIVKQSILLLVDHDCVQEGASDEDIDLLPKYKFRRIGNYVTTGDLYNPSGGVMSILAATPGAGGERVLLAEDAVILI